MQSFGALSNFEFEQLVGDLLFAETGEKYERFRRGPDGGIDLRCSVPELESLSVVQCKHFEKSSFSQLKTAAEAEVAKLEALQPQPTEYRFVTSQSLTIGKKDELLEVFADWIASPDGLWSNEDLEDLLGRHVDVERNHVKLWLSSSTQLETLLNSGTVNKTRDLVEDIRRTLPRYVQTERYGNAEDVLSGHGVCLIAGQPGIGKSTLAQMLLLDSVDRGFEAIYISDDVDEGWDLAADRPQVFFYDDFLGRIGLTGLNKNEDKRIVQLINRALRDPKKTRLILTTREYILRDAADSYDSLNEIDIEREKFTLAMTDYSRFERGLILYNHVYHSEAMHQEWKVDLTQDGRYLEIVDHSNYNPRLIEFITGHAKAGELDHLEGDWIGFAIQALNNPEEIWLRAFRTELDLLQRSVLLMVVSFGRTVSESELADSTRSVLDYMNVPFEPTQFNRCLRVLELTFINIRPGPNGLLVSVANPSIDDFIMNMLANERQLLRQVVNGSTSFEQLRNLWEVSESQKREMIGVKLQLGLSEISEEFAKAMIRTLSDDETGSMNTDGAGTSSMESDLNVLIRAVGTEIRGDPGMKNWLEEGLETLMGEWEAGNVSKRAAVGLYVTLKAYLGDDEAQPFGRVLKLKLMDSLFDEEDFDVFDDLNRADGSLITEDEWGEASSSLRAYAQVSFSDDDLDADEVDRISTLASYYDVDVESEAAELIAKIEAREAEREFDIDDYERARELQTDAFDSDEELRDLFAGLDE